MQDDPEKDNHAQRVQRLFPEIQFASHALQKLASFEDEAPPLEVQCDAFEEWLVESFDRWDPIGLMNSTYSQPREYIIESRMVRTCIERCESVEELSDRLLDIFEHQFWAGLPRERYEWMAERIFTAWRRYRSE